MDDSDYLIVLRALDELPFGVGKKLLCEFLQGNRKNDSVIRNRLDQLDNFGALSYEIDELEPILDMLLWHKCIEQNTVNGKSFWKVYDITPKGIDELKNPCLNKQKMEIEEEETIITSEDKERFLALGAFLTDYNDEQKKAIISPAKQVLCIAGAGSGKTTVLTKRIDFLTKYKSVAPERILAITFTRKARQEMQDRLSHLPGVHIQTFNSFCEQIMKRNPGFFAHDRVIAYSDKFKVMNQALKSIGKSMGQAINIYFTEGQQRSKTIEQLGAIFMNDCFFVRDYFKSKHKKIEYSEFSLADDEHQQTIQLVVAVCNFIDAFMKKHKLRDYADQIIDMIELFENHKELIPGYDHILVDEYQDVNSSQIKLIELLNPPSLFTVGDPRQSIYGWRGSDIRYILDFKAHYPDSEIITLKNNYRSTKPIVDLINESIKAMRVADLVGVREGEKFLNLLKFKSQATEFEFIIQRINATSIPRNEIFVLGRTNKQLNEFSAILKQRGIPHILRSDEVRRTTTIGARDITLATCHAIKGLEAEMVFVMGCNSNSFPCKGTEHPVIEMVKLEEYDKEEEERRLFYVAMSRAKTQLYLTYTGAMTRFITPAMLSMLDAAESKDLALPKAGNAKSGDLVARLKEWRLNVSRDLSIPPYMILHDVTIFDIAARLPMDNAQLQEINGLGPQKIMKYGESILDIVNS